MNSSDARSGGAVLAPQHGDEGPWVRWPMSHGRTQGDVRAQCRLVAAAARSSGRELAGSGGPETPRRSSSPVASSAIRAPQQFSAVQINYIPGRGTQRGVADRKSREAHAGCAGAWSSGGQVAPTEGSEACGTPGMEVERSRAETWSRPTVGARSSQTSPPPRISTVSSPPTAALRHGRSGRLSGRGSR